VAGRGAALTSDNHNIPELILRHDLRVRGNASRSCGTATTTTITKSNRGTATTATTTTTTKTNRRNRPAVSL
jgi:hypothetical protein